MDEAKRVRRMNVEPIKAKGYRDGLAGAAPCPNVLASAYPEAVKAYTEAHEEGTRERSLQPDARRG